MPYLVDGHNLIPKLGLHLASPDDEMELVAMLQEFSRLSRREVQVYFDGAPPGHAHSRKFAAVTAHFVHQGSSADQAIMTQLQRLGRAARNWTVVTSDRQVQATARSLHAGVMPSEEFAGQLRRIQQSADRPAAEQESSAEEIREWLRLFNTNRRT